MTPRPAPRWPPVTETASMVSWRRSAGFWIRSSNGVFDRAKGRSSGDIEPYTSWQDRPIRSIVRKWNELGIVAGNRRPAPELPVGFRLVDALLARRHEVPPDVAGGAPGRAAENHNARASDGSDGDAVVGAEHQEPLGFEAVAAHVDLAFHDEDRALLVVGVERHFRAGLERHLGEDRVPRSEEHTS